MLPWLRQAGVDVARAMAPTTAASGGGSRQTTLGSWAFNQTGLWQPAGRRSTSQVTRSAPAQPLVYQITETTQLLLQRADITLFDGDAIVNAGAMLPQHSGVESQLLICREPTRSMLQSARFQV